MQVTFNDGSFSSFSFFSVIVSPSYSSICSSLCLNRSSLGLVLQTDFLTPLSFLLFLGLTPSADTLPLASAALAKLLAAIATLLIFLRPWSCFFWADYKDFFPDLIPESYKSGLSPLFSVTIKSLIGVLKTRDSV